MFKLALGGDVYSTTSMFSIVINFLNKKFVNFVLQSHEGITFYQITKQPSIEYFLHFLSKMVFRISVYLYRQLSTYYLRKTTHLYNLLVIQRTPHKFMLRTFDTVN